MCTIAGREWLSRVLLDAGDQQPSTPVHDNCILRSAVLQSELQYGNVSCRRISFVSFVLNCVVRAPHC